MKIAIIGAGNVGAALARASVSAGHSVTITAADPSNAATVAAATGATALDNNVEAITDADLVVLAVPSSAIGVVVEQLDNLVSGKTVVDSTNPLNATYSDLDIQGKSAAEDLQQLMPRASVVKAFNTIFAARYATPSENGEPIDAYIAGDDDIAKDRVAELATSLGFRAVDAGGLRMARALEEMAFLNISLNARNGWPWQSAWTLLGPTKTV